LEYRIVKRRAVPGGKGRKEEGIKVGILSFGPPYLFHP